ncbi:MAG: SnoaL-like domain-containing protein [Candidatus Marinimicrobia bacterium]|jgi:hypothetical protein|nr:SnoaL-like domain-containing protein [Candidatus Neomarinimicrobiota bacterium]MBT3617300.1 SnoaL-like domain-containing protein [Candidatus Neomarinimicrobiota bacterium]MBT3828863.1 SnoaL-like domain-containing protein [Candidatus Neomarinimicrobiota bacterium]MBT3996688.1 SnoaL-like domain-containing protein [Candidatus Neomarinimicrobiota bacterium]MBT4281313.1 SnoaL-like domain-containing protein [Candidatus Neomarinimicrobiota bacterium]
MKNLIFAFAIVVLGCEKNIADHNEKLIENIIDEIRLGWENGDGTAFRSHFLDWDGARFFEGGGQNIGLEDLIVNHVEPEAELGLKLEFTNIQIHFEENFAWAVVDTEIELTTSTGREIHNKGHGTYLLRWVNGVWRVVHTQSASKPV